MKKQAVDMHQLLNNSEGSDSLLPAGFRMEDYSLLEVMPLYELILHIYRSFNLEKLKNQSAYLYTFLDNLMGYLQQNPSDINSFLNYWNEELFKKSVPNESGLGGVRAMTIHKAKGLQFHTVIVAFCDWKMDDSRNGLVWCDKKEAPFNLEVLPINHNKQMQQSVFAKEYLEEISHLYMDNLNVTYVAFTRAESNLIILSKANTSKTIASVIENLCTADLPGTYDGEKQQLVIGEIDNSQKSNENASSNILKSNTKIKTVSVDFISQEILDKDTIFRQSNKSKEFIATGEAPAENQYIQKGNVMHELFSYIHTLADAPKAMERLIFEGLITRDEQEAYLDKINQSVISSQVEQWFSNDYQLFNECLILLKDENGKTRTRRPDRVMIGNNEVIVVDYKFGEAHDSHALQVQQYKELLGKMGYANVKGFLWYVGENKTIEISE